MLFTPERHESIGAYPYSQAAARAAITTIADRAQRELDDATRLWPRDPTDTESVGEGRASSLFWGASGVAWALDELVAAGHIANGVDDDVLEAAAARIVGDRNDPDFEWPGVWFGLAGVLAVAEHRRADMARLDRIAELADASLDSPALEPMQGHPGYMLLAAQLHAATNEPRWKTFWSRGADALLAKWEHDVEHGWWLWTQELHGRRVRGLGAAHGFAGNVRVLRAGAAFLAPDLRAEIDRRAVETLMRLAVIEDGHANWPTAAGDPLIVKDRIRVQWCHGAVGVITSMWDAAPADDAWTDLLLAAGRLVWDAGPIRNERGLCHGTAGNAYALLALWARTNDELWLERACAFAQHAAAQVEERASRLGRGHHSLYTGDEGVALALASCIAGDARFPVVDRLI